MEKRFYVYEYYIKDTDEVFYVGKGTGYRKTRLDNRSDYFMAVYNKYDCDVRVIKDCITNEEACSLEIERIAELREMGQARCNFTEGGTGFSTGHLNPTYRTDHRGSNNKFYGKKHTEETKRLMSEHRRGKGGRSGKDNPMYGSKRFAGENNPMYGVKRFDHPNSNKYLVDGEYYTYKECERKFGIAFSRVSEAGGKLHYKKNCKSKELYEGLGVIRIK